MCGGAKTCGASAWVIAGGGDSAVDWALALKDIARVAGGAPAWEVPRPPRKVRHSWMRPHKTVKWRWWSPISCMALLGVDGVLSAVEVATLDGVVKALPADVLLPFFGLSMDLGPIAAWGAAKSGASRNRRSRHLPDQPCPGCSRSATSPPIPAN